MKEVMREQLSVIKGHRNGEDLEGEGQAQDLQVSWKELQNVWDLREIYLLKI